MSTLRTDTLQTTDSSFSVNIADLVGVTQVNSAIDTALFNTSSKSVATYALVSSIDVSKFTRAVATGYYAEGDGVVSFWRYVPSDTTSTVDGVTVLSSSSGPGRWKLNHNGSVTTKQAGCKADGTTDDSSRLAAWFSAVMSLNLEGIISYGTHKISTATTWNFTTAAVSGCRIRGSAPNGCTLDFSSVPSAQGTPFQWIATGTVALFYQSFANFHIVTNYQGVGFRIGKEDFTDAWNSCTFSKLIVNNYSQTNENVSLQLNHVLQATIDVVVNAGGSGRPDAATSPGWGTALQQRQCLFCNFTALAVGNANKGLYVTAGYNYGNSYHGIDMEEVNYGYVCDTPNATHNTFYNGQWLALNVINSTTSGAANEFRNLNINSYSGGTIKVATVGCVFSSPQVYDVTTPSVPSSGAVVANTTGRTISVDLAGGTVSAINVTQFGGLVVGIPVGTWAGRSVILNPGESISVTYSAAFSWVWRPFN